MPVYIEIKVMSNLPLREMIVPSKRDVAHVPMLMKSSAKEKSDLDRGAARLPTED